MQMFRQREHVRIGSPEQVLSFRELWMERARTLVATLGLPFTVEIANDPFFGRAGRMLAANQRDENLKFELLLAIATPARPNACISFNYHRDHFGKAWDIRTHDDRVAHTGCVGFGVERIALALLAHHGLRVADWPAAVRDVLAL